MQFEAEKAPEKPLALQSPMAIESNVSPRSAMSFTAKSESPRPISVKEKFPAEKGKVTLKIITELSKCIISSFIAKEF